MALIEGITTRTFISSQFPFETIRVFAGHNKYTGKLRLFISHHSSRGVARQVFGYVSKHGSKLVEDEDFDLIYYWEIIPRVLKDFPRIGCVNMWFVLRQ